jgi:non-ribosomal peptide synthetase component F
MSQLFDQLKEIASETQKIQKQSFDNLFNADHRNAMLEKYGYTEAQTVTIEELMLTI